MTIFNMAFSVDILVTIQICHFNLLIPEEDWNIWIDLEALGGDRLVHVAPNGQMFSLRFCWQKKFRSKYANEICDENSSDISISNL